MRTSEFYIDRANESFQAGFKTMAAKKSAISDLNSAYDIESQNIRNLVLDIPRENRSERHDLVYWSLPGLHVWREKHADLVLSVFENARPIIQKIDDIAELRKVIANAEVIKKELNTNKVKADHVQKSIREVMELRKAQFARGLNLNDHFGGLSITANVHYVVNEYGTEFLRAFYYMDGIMTPLNVIIAVYEKIAADKK